MSSDNIKAALMLAFPGTSDAQWKRRQKAKVAEGVERIFENTADGKLVRTVEDAKGNVVIGGPAVLKTATAKPPKATPTKLYDEGLAAKVTETGQAVLKEMVAAGLPKTLTMADGLSEALLGEEDKPKSKPVPKRTQMVPGSRWKVTRDVPIKLWVENPAYNDLISARNRTPAQQAEINRMVENFERVIQVEAATIKAGAIITVEGKLTASGLYSYGTRKDQTNGLLIPAALEGEIELAPATDRFSKRHIMERWGYRGKSKTYEKLGYEIPYSQVESALEALEVPEKLVYVLRDKETGLFFGGWKTIKTNRVGYGGQTYTDTRTTDEPKMVEKFSSAKKYATSSAVKASIREFTGYNDGLNDENGTESGAYYVQGGSKKMDLPPTWEMVAVDKPTGVEKAIIDVQDWFKGLMRLRVLTQGHGSAVRAIYKKAEDNAALTHLIVFQNRPRGSWTDRDGKVRYYDEAETWEDRPDADKALAAIKEAAGFMSGKTERVRTNTAVAYACSLVDAFAAKMAFDYDDVEVRVLDKTTLEEVVQQQGEPA